MTNDEFTALRSMRKEPWVILNNKMLWRIPWRIKNVWYYIDYAGVRTRCDAITYDGRLGYESIYYNAEGLAKTLIDKGLVSQVTKRCCPGTDCHLNDRLEYRLTETGNDFLTKIDC